MLKNVYKGLNARPKVYLPKEYFCEMYPTCVSSKLCKFIFGRNSKSEFDDSDKIPNHVQMAQTKYQKN